MASHFLLTSRDVTLERGSLNRLEVGRYSQLNSDPARAHSRCREPYSERMWETLQPGSCLLFVSGSPQGRNAVEVPPVTVHPSSGVSEFALQETLRMSSLWEIAVSDAVPSAILTRGPLERNCVTVMYEEEPQPQLEPPEAPGSSHRESPAAFSQNSDLGVRRASIPWVSTVLDKYCRVSWEGKLLALTRWRKPLGKYGVIPVGDTIL